MYGLQSMIPLMLHSVYQIKNDNSSTYFNILKEKFISLEVLTTQSDNSHARFQKRPLVEGGGQKKISHHHISQRATRSSTKKQLDMSLLEERVPWIRTSIYKATYSTSDFPGGLDSISPDPPP